MHLITFITINHRIPNNDLSVGEPFAHISTLIEDRKLKTVSSRHQEDRRVYTQQRRRNFSNL